MRPPESSQGMSAVLQIEAWMCGRGQCVEKEERTERKVGRDGWMNGWKRWGVECLLVSQSRRTQEGVGVGGVVWCGRGGGE